MYDGKGVLINSDFVIIGNWKRGFRHGEQLRIYKDGSYI